MAFITVERRGAAVNPRYMGYSTNINPRTGYPYSAPLLQGLGASSQGVVSARDVEKTPPPHPLYPYATDPVPIPGYNKDYYLDPTMSKDYKRNSGAYNSGIMNVRGGPDKNVLVTDATLPGQVRSDFTTTNEIKSAATTEMENSTVIDPQHLLPGNSLPSGTSTGTSLDVSVPTGTSSSSFMSSIPSWMMMAGVIVGAGSIGLLIGKAISRR